MRTGADYGVTVTSHNITQIAWLLSTKLTFWGVPGDPRHDRQRGWHAWSKYGPCPASTATAPPPFLALPTSCEAPYESTLRGDSWSTPGAPPAGAPKFTYRTAGSARWLQPSAVRPVDHGRAGHPEREQLDGLTVGVHVSQTAALNPEGLAESTVRDTTVTLPEGVALNPAGADGLEACSEAQIGFTGVEARPAEDRPVHPGLAAAPFCPDASKIGTVKIKTPLLPNPLEGAVYLAPQNANPFGSLVAMYIVAQDPVSGVLVKLAGEVTWTEHTGQIVATFKNTPQLPFEELELHFFGGERAPLGTPALCGTYTTEASFAPWSGNAPVDSVLELPDHPGPNGSPCSDPLPFSPSLTAGTTNIQAGGFSPFTMTMSREDGNQNLQGDPAEHAAGPVRDALDREAVRRSAGERGDVRSGKPESGKRPSASAWAANPYTVTGGKVYITGPYEGAPFGLSIVNPAKAGPFDLGKVIVRAKIEVDPTPRR